MAEVYSETMNGLYGAEGECKKRQELEHDALKVDEEGEEILEEQIETRCGFGSCRPRFLQRCNSPPVLLGCLCVYTLVHGFAVNGINNVNTTSYERRFDLTSSSVGWISSVYDISAAICGVVIGFYGNRRNKGRILTMAFIMSSVGSLCMWLPHFITPSYEWGRGQSHLCSAKGRPLSETAGKCAESDGTLSSFLTLLLIGQLMHGLGGSTLITVGYSFIDDSVTAATSPVYISMIGLCQMLGPMVGFLVGGVLLDVYVDFERIPKSMWELTPTDPRWVGAWWVGFFISSILMFIFALPFLFFGAELPTAKYVRETRESETHNDGEPKKLDNTISVRHFPALLCRLLRNPAFMCVAFAGAFMGLVTIAMATFLPKYIQNIYGTTASAAATYAGLIVIPGAALGQMFGGFVIRRWRLKVQSILKFLIAVVTLAMISKACFFINCDIVVWNTNITDIEPFTSMTTNYSNFSESVTSMTTNYSNFSKPVTSMTTSYSNFKEPITSMTTNSSNFSEHVTSMTTNYSNFSEPVTSVTTNYSNFSEPVTSVTYADCSENCHCDESVYQVVCDGEGRTYYSPCLAGCQSELPSKTYADCQCVSSRTNVTSVTMENCMPSTCNSLLYIFLFMIFLSAFFVSSSTVPALTVVLRCAHENERTFALGLLNFIARVVGTIPGPILYGSVIDSTCEMWGKKCGHNTSCWNYDNAKMGENLALLGMGFTGVASFFFFLSYKLYKPPVPKKKETTSEKDPAGATDLETPVGICALPNTEVSEDTRL